MKENPAALDLLDAAELRGITPAEVQELRRETLGDGRGVVAISPEAPATSVQEERMQAVAAFVDAARSRRDLSGVPVLV